MDLALFLPCCLRLARFCILLYVPISLPALAFLVAHAILFCFRTQRCRPVFCKGCAFSGANIVNQCTNICQAPLSTSMSSWARMVGNRHSLRVHVSDKRSYPGQLLIVHIKHRLSLNLRVSSTDVLWSSAHTPGHLNFFIWSITSFMYTSLFPPFGECFPRMRRFCMTEKRLVVIHDGKLYTNTNTGQVDHWHRKEENELNPSVDSAMRMFRKPATNDGNLMSIARHAGESCTPCILPSVDLLL